VSLSIRPFYMFRHEDQSGISGTGIVATGVQFPNGRVVLQWCSYRNSLEVHDSITNLEEIHGHAGKTEIIFGNPPDPNAPPKKSRKKKET
jgi:hypothetical protein